MNTKILSKMLKGKTILMILIRVLPSMMKTGMIPVKIRLVLNLLGKRKALSQYF